ncbi:hypothetical protein BD769DRAFT_1674458 [Suillus cothurnatus]|nr:hypothetical protein BD769DRAFT_1674458 [Suillus cothurnatus]
MKGVPRIPAGFFDDALREANLRIRLSQSHELHNHPTSTPRQRTLSPFYSFWHRSKLNIISEREVKSRPRPFSWTWDLSGLLRRQDESDIQLQDVEVPCTAGKPRNYHATGKKAASLSRPPKIHATQQPSATTQSTPPSSQQPPPTAAASTLSVAASTPGTIGAVSRPNITIRNSGWRTRLMLWVCCMPIQNTDSQH